MSAATSFMLGLTCWSRSWVIAVEEWPITSDTAFTGSRKLYYSHVSSYLLLVIDFVSSVESAEREVRARPEPERRTGEVTRWP
jgi:hypothetical protein